MLENQFIIWAESIRAQVLYDMNFSVSINKFYAFDFLASQIEQRKLNFDIYKR
jgi:hypothetical protein